MSSSSDTSVVHSSSSSSPSAVHATPFLRRPVCLRLVGTTTVERSNPIAFAAILGAATLLGAVVGAVLLLEQN